MDAMDEFQEADILWPDDTEDELVVPFTPMDTEEPYQAAGSVSSIVAPVFGRRFKGLFLSGAGPSSFSAGASCHDADDDDEEWQEADVLWPDTEDEPLAGGLMWPFSGSSGSGGGRAGWRVKPAAARWTTGLAASSPINIPANVAPHRRFRTAMMSRRS